MLSQLSLTQKCEEWLWLEVKRELNDQELMHTLAHSGPGHGWVSAPPLLYKNWNMTPLEWIACTRRRLGLDVFPAEIQCTACQWSRQDTKGNHATMCKGGASRILRHNEVRDIVGKAFQEIGYEIGFEHGGGLQDGRKPGDVIVYNWKNRKHLLIDVAITNPLAPTNHTLLLTNGPGHTARHWENKKRTKYWDLDTMTYDFWPFIIETTGAFGPSALALCTMIANKRKMKCWDGINNQAELKDEKGLFGQDPLSSETTHI